MEFEQVRFRKGEAVRLEGVSGSAEGNPLLQVPRNFLKDDFLKKKKKKKQETFTDRVTTVILLNITAMIYPRPFKLFIHPPMFSDSSDKVEEPCS